MEKSVVSHDQDPGRTADAAHRGAIRWLSIHDDLLRALAHAISNRMATVAALATLLEHGLTPEPRIADGVRQDAERMEGLLRALRDLPRRPDTLLEPMLLTDAVAGARALLEEHPDLGTRAVQVTLEGDVQPVRADPGAALHACAVAILAAARYVGPSGTIGVTIRTLGDLVQLDATGDRGPHYGAEELLEDDACAITWLLAGADGRAERGDAGCRFALPTLQASRRRLA